MKCHLLQPDRGNDQEDGEDDHEKVEDEDEGEGIFFLFTHFPQLIYDSLLLQIFKFSHIFAEQIWKWHKVCAAFEAASNTSLSDF